MKFQPREIPINMRWSILQGPKRGKLKCLRCNWVSQSVPLGKSVERYHARMSILAKGHANKHAFAV